MLSLAMRTLSPKRDYEHFRDQNAENPVRKKKNKADWRIDGTGNREMRTHRKVFL